MNCETLSAFLSNGDKDDGSCFSKVMEQRVGKNAKRSAKSPIIFGGRATPLLIPYPDMVEIEDVSAFGGKADAKILAGRVR